MKKKKKETPKKKNNGAGEEEQQEEQQQGRVVTAVKKNWIPEVQLLPHVWDMSAGGGYTAVTTR